MYDWARCFSNLQWLEKEHDDPEMAHANSYSNVSFSSNIITKTRQSNNFSQPQQILPVTSTNQKSIPLPKQNMVIVRKGLILLAFS